MGDKGKKGIQPKELTLIMEILNAAQIDPKDVVTSGLVDFGSKSITIEFPELKSKIEIEPNDKAFSNLWFASVDDVNLYGKDSDGDLIEKVLEVLDIWVREQNWQLKDLREFNSVKEKWIPSSFTSDSSNNDNGQSDLFSSQEIQQIKGSILEIKSQLKKVHKLNKAQTALLDKLVDVAPKIDKIDWKNLLVGTMINLAQSLALSPEARTNFFGLFTSAFSWFSKQLM